MIQWKEEQKVLLGQIELIKEKREFFEQNKPKRKKRISTSKKIILFLFINCSAIEIFTGYITLVDLHLASQTGLVDFTPIVTLIGAVVSEIIGFAIYAAKATKENTSGGVVFESMMNNFASQENNDIEIEG